MKNELENNESLDMIQADGLQFDADEHNREYLATEVSNYENNK